MLHSKYDFAIIGGDMRQIYMANELMARGYLCTVYGLENPILNSSCYHSSSLTEALSLSFVIIAPIPITKDGKNINSQFIQSDLTIDKLCSLLSPNHKVYGGCIPNELLKHLEKNNISYLDFMESDEVAIFNSIATAEGTIAEAILSSTINLHGSSCLILGYGRCAQTLANKLKSLCSHIDIAARSSKALITADAASFGTFPLSELESNIKNYDFIFNTIPALILTKELLAKTKPEVVIIDIASNPGGLDYNAAKELKRNAKLCLSLPGKCAPKASALFLVNYLLLNLGEK